MTTANTPAVNLMEANHQWATRPKDQRFSTLESLGESVNNRRLRSRAIDINCERIEAKHEHGRLVLNGTIQPCEPSHWSFGQIAAHIGAPANYLRSLDKNPGLLVDNLNFGIRNNPARDAVKFMTIASESGEVNTLQAVTSTTYGRIWDADCVQAVSHIVENSNGKFYNPPAYANSNSAAQAGTIERAGLYASDRDVFMFLIDGGSRLEVGHRAKLNRGFMVWNSETGSKTFGLMTFLFNEVCGNNIVWGATEVNKLFIRHSAGGPSRFDLQAMPALKAYVESSAAPEEAIISRAVNQIVCNGTKDEPNGLDSLASFLNRVGKFTKSEVTGCFDFAKAEEGDCKTLWQVVQGLTAYARGFDFIDARVDLEKRAGALLNLAK